MEHRRSQSIVQDKSFRFTVQLIGYIRRQPKDPINLVLTRQLLRSGTSIGANVEEALRRKLTAGADSEPKPRTQNPEPKTQNSELPNS